MIFCNDIPAHILYGLCCSRVGYKVATLTLAEALEYEAQIQDIAIRTADHQEGVRAFLKKRPPPISR